MATNSTNSTNNSGPVDKICSPFGSEKGEKMALVQAEPVFKKARKERMREKMATPRVSTKKTAAILKKTALCKEVVCELQSLQEMNASFGIRNKNEFIEVRDISIDASGKLCYSNSSNELKSLSSLIIEVKGLPTARWLNHLYFKNGCGEEHSFKKFVSQKYNLKFT